MDLLCEKKKHETCHAHGIKFLINSSGNYIFRLKLSRSRGLPQLFAAGFSLLGIVNCPIILLF